MTEHNVIDMILPCLSRQQHRTAPLISKVWGRQHDLMIQNDILQQTLPDHHAPPFNGSLCMDILVDMSHSLCVTLHCAEESSTQDAAPGQVFELLSR